MGTVKLNGAVKWRIALEVDGKQQHLESRAFADPEMMQQPSALHLLLVFLAHFRRRYWQTELVEPNLDLFLFSNVAAVSST